MNWTETEIVKALLLLTSSLGVVVFAHAAGGPFAVTCPGGDPAAKSVLAHLRHNLKPAREERLEVVKEDLTITFDGGVDFRGAASNRPPLATVVADYHIRNPTSEKVEVDFGFPILRGIYMSPFGMMPAPDVWVASDGKRVEATVISTSAIYGLIRRQSRMIVEDAIASDEPLAEAIAAVRRAPAEAREAAKEALRAHLTDRKGWNARDAALLAEYAVVDLRALAAENLGALAAIGEQKATQFFAQIAGRFSPASAAGYEGIFKAWVGDVTARSADLTSGADPTLCARVDCLGGNSKLKDEEKTSCRTILKNLPVVSSFAPMNLLHCRLAFQPDSEQTVSVNYRQFAYEDAKAPASYQLAYVVHPASLWRQFGPINLKVIVPGGVGVRASAPCERLPGEVAAPAGRGAQAPRDVYGAEIKDKTGELFVGIDRAAWDAYARTATLAPQPNR